MKKILIRGLPGSGKTTLANQLVKYLKDADFYNADEIRQKHDDWDFSIEGRTRQTVRMKNYAQSSVDENRYAVCDFVCPTKELCELFDPDYIIWVNTIEQGRFEDTNRIFESIDNSDVVITKDKWWNLEFLDHWAKTLAVEIKDSEFDTQQPTTQMLGRFQPFHPGHRALFERALAKHGQVAILIRDMPIADNNPWNQSDIELNIKKELVEYAGKFRIYKVPNIVNITYGRDVGYKIEQEVFDDAIHAISATEIRKKLRDEGKLK